MEQHIEYVQQLIRQGGPEVADYEELDDWIAEVAEHARTGKLTEEEIDTLRMAFCDAISVKTMQGFVFNKPHGYAGDYEIIDRIYQTYIAPDSHLSRWDKYMQTHAASDAVRNRKTYLHQVLDTCSRQSGKPSIEVLNVASGPGRDMLEYLERKARGGGNTVKFIFTASSRIPGPFNTPVICATPISIK